MTIDRELVLQLAAQRAGFTGSQLDALRRGDYAALLAEQFTPSAEPGPPVDDVSAWDQPVHHGPDHTPGHGPDHGPDDASDNSLHSDGLPSAAHLQERLERVSRRLAAVRQQRDAALHVIRQLAAKLGCCARCWGTDVGCASCAGHGSPGHFPPDPRLREWLAPALAADAGPGPYAPGPSPPPAEHQTPYLPGPA